MIPPASNAGGNEASIREKPRTGATTPTTHRCFKGDRTNKKRGRAPRPAVPLIDVPLHMACWKIGNCYVLVQAFPFGMARGADENKKNNSLEGGGTVAVAR